MQAITLAAAPQTRQVSDRRGAIGIAFIGQIDAADHGGYLNFAAESHIDPVALVQLVQNDNRRYRLQGSHRLQITAQLDDIEKRFREIEELLQTLPVKNS